MNYIIEEGYPKLRDIDKDNSETAQNYKNMFSNNNISGAQNLIDNDIESENYNGFIAFTADKMNALKEVLIRLQNIWYNILNRLLGWFQNIGQDIQPYLSTNTYNKGDVVTYNNITYMCVEENVTGTFNPIKWVMLNPSGIGFDITDTVITTNNDNKVRTISYNNENIAIILPDMIALDDEDDAVNGMIYLIENGDGSSQIKYKYDDDIDELYPYTNSTISLYGENYTIQSALNDLKDVVGGVQ